jgi:glycosyltransferase involved in cell wall biosynthesis
MAHALCLMDQRLRLLYVLHRFETTGGIEAHSRALIEELQDEADITVTVPELLGRSGPDMRLEQLAPHLRVARINLDRCAPGLRVIGFRAALEDPAIERAFGKLLEARFHVIHFQSILGWNTLRLPRLARASGAGVAISAHDLSLNCADYNMMTGPDDRPCGRTAAHGSDPHCVGCLSGKSAPADDLQDSSALRRYIDDRHEAARIAISSAHAVICPSEFIASRLRRGFAASCESNLVLIPHGVRDYPIAYAPDRGAELRVAFVGRFCDRKGGDVAVSVARRLHGERIAFEAWGPVEPRLWEPARAAGIALRGEYQPSDLERGLAGVDLILIPSMLEESFCLVLSEVQRLGIPVAASGAGAIPERVREGETGFLFPCGDVAAIARLLLELRDDRERLDRVARRLREERPMTVAQSAQQYRRLYRQLRSPLRPTLTPA